MYREIKKKKLILENRKPYTREAESLIRELARIQWIHSSLLLEGCKLTRPVVEGLLKGEFFTEVSIGDHMAVSNFNQAIDYIYNITGMAMDLDDKIMLKILALLTGGNVTGYRQDNPVLRMMDYNPPHFKEVDEQMDMVFQQYKRDKGEENPIMVAAKLHNQLVEIYPYQRYSEAMARIAASYHLISSQLPPAPWNMNEQEYYEGLTIYLKKEDSSPIYNMLERSVFNSLEVMMQLTSGA